MSILKYKMLKNWFYIVLCLLRKQNNNLCLQFYQFIVYLFIIFSHDTNFVFTSKQKHSKYVNFLLNINITLKFHIAHTSLFLHKMLHSTNESLLLNQLYNVGDMTTQIPTPSQVSINFSLHTLMSHTCDLSKI